MSQPHPPRTQWPEVRLAIEAMATRFELSLPLVAGAPATALRAAGEEALTEVQRVESQLSIYQPYSDLARVNAHGARVAVQVSPPVFSLLQRARELTELSGGTFDPTIGPLIRHWRAGQWSEVATDPTLQILRAATGWNRIELDPGKLSVRFHHPLCRLDLGSLGKGWALDRASDILREAGVTDALLHGGTSTVLALGSPPDRTGWEIQVATGPDLRPTHPFPNGPEFISLSDQALSVSATWGQSRLGMDGQSFGHLFDPRNGTVIAATRRSILVGPLAADTDAISTALLVSGPSLLPAIAHGHFGPHLQGWWD